jgi:tetratricopeptide (TPR) repeat protein
MGKDDLPIEDLPQDFIREILTALSGSPTITSLLSGAIQKGVEGAMGPVFSTTAGGNPLFPGTFFTDQNVGTTMLQEIQRRDMMDMMQQQDNLATVFRAQQASLLSQVGGASAAEGDVRAGRLTATTFLSNALFNQAFQPGRFFEGLEQGVRNAGFISPVIGGEAAEARNTQLQAAAAALTSGFFSDPAGFGGLSGEGVGRVVSEGFRTGLFNEFGFSTAEATRVNAAAKGLKPGENLADLSDLSDIKDKIQGFQQKAQEASQAIASFGQIFRGNVIQVLDQANQVFGGDVIQTLGASGAESVFNRLAAVGQVGQFTPQQLGGVAFEANAMFRQLGQDAFGAPAAATEALLGITAARTAIDNPFAFVNEGRFQRSFLQNTVAAQSSGLSQALGGAYALLRQQGFTEEDAIARVQGIQGGGPGGLSARDIAGALGGMDDDLQGLTGVDVLAAGNFADARRFRIRGLGTAQAVQANNTLIQTARRGVLQNLGLGGLDFGEGPLTLRRVEETLARSGLAPGQQARALGAFRDVLTQQAEFFGFGNADELDLSLEASANQEALGIFRNAIDAIDETNQVFAGTGALRGIGGLLEAIKKGGADTTITKALQGFFGGGEIGDIQIAGQNLQKALGDDPNNKILGGTLIEAITSGTVGGKRITGAQRKEAIALFNRAREGAGEGLLGDINTFLREANPDISDQADILKAARDITGDSDLTAVNQISQETLQQARQKVGLDRLQTQARTDQTKNIAARISELTPEMSFEEAKAQAFEEAGIKKGDAAMSEFNLNFNEQVPGFGKPAGMGGILNILEDIRNFLRPDKTDGGAPNPPKPGEEPPPEERGGG